jgi:hypothetical protein
MHSSLFAYENSHKHIRLCEGGPIASENGLTQRRVRRSNQIGGDEIHGRKHLRHLYFQCAIVHLCYHKDVWVYVCVCVCVYVYVYVYVCVCVREGCGGAH